MAVYNLFDRVAYPTHYWATERLLKATPVSFDDLSIASGAEPPTRMCTKVMGLVVWAVEEQGGRVTKHLDRRYGMIYQYFPEEPFKSEFRVSQEEQIQLGYPIGQHIKRQLEKARRELGERR